MTRTRMIIIGLVLLLMVGATFFRVVFPFESHVMTARLELFFSGVKTFQAGGFTGLERDLCDSADPEARGCTCVALLHGLGDDEKTWGRLLQAPKSAWVKPVRLYAVAVPRNQRFIRGENPSQYGVRTQAEALGKALAPLCPSWVVVGNSLGGWEAAWMVLDHRLKIEKLLLVDSAGLRSVLKTRAKELFTNPTPENVHELLRLIFAKPPQLSQLAWKKASETLSEADLGGVLNAQKEGDLLDGRVASLRLPTMVFWGARDGLIPESIGKELQAQIPSSVWREAPDCGHLPQKECPVELIQGINDMIRMGAM